MKRHAIVYRFYIIKTNKNIKKHKYIIMEFN